MRTKTSRIFNKKIELWETTSQADGFGGLISQNNLVGLIWANVRDVSVQNYDVAGSSQNLTQKRILVRKAGLSSNINFFVIKGKAYKINDIISNYKENQFECICEATNFEIS